MELHLRPETKARLNDLAQRTNRGADEPVDEAVEHLMAYQQWLEQKVSASRASVSRGEKIPDEEVRAWLDEHERR